MSKGDSELLPFSFLSFTVDYLYWEPQILLGVLTISEEVYLDLLPTSQSQDPTVGMASGVHSRSHSHSNFLLTTVDVLR
eukprot:scaffold26780_cov133-Skeletonema_dohrnii-CCMP3373.AAC.1